MAEKWTLRWVLTHPVSAIAGIITVGGGLLQLPLIDPVFGVIWSNAGALLAVATVTAGQIAPRIPMLEPWIPTLQLAVLVTAILFAVQKLVRVARSAREQFTEEETT